MADDFTGYNAYAYDPNIGNPNDFTEDDWLERIALTPEGNHVFSKRSSKSSILVEIPFSKIVSAKSFVLGYDYADKYAPYFLHRRNPIRHPLHLELVADSVQFRPYVPVGNPMNFDNAPHVDSADLSINITSYANYQKALMMVEFGQLPYNLRNDADRGTGWNNEYERNVDFFSDVSAEVNVISASTAKALTFCEGSTPPKGSSFPGDLGEYISKLNFVWKWFDVPHEYIFQPNGVPQKLLNCLGYVNNSKFAGCEAGTLLLQGVRLTKFQLPYVTSNYDPAFLYDVTFHVQFFDPPPALGYPDPPAPAVPTTGSQFRGHNLMPWAQKVAGKSSIWYAATRGGGTSDVRYLPEIDFATMFEHVLA